jgi:hypothetical protein
VSRPWQHDTDRRKKREIMMPGFPWFQFLMKKPFVNNLLRPEAQASRYWF